MFKTLLLSTMLIFSLTTSLQAEDAEGSKDHPLFQRMPGFQIHNYEHTDFNGFDFFMDKDKEKTHRVEGISTTIEYIVPGDSHPSVLKVLRNHIDAIKKIGGQVVMQGENLATFKLVKPGREVWTNLEIFNEGGAYTLNIIEKASMKQEISSNDMLEALNRDGHIALYINFDTAKSTIKPESKSVIAEIVKLLQENADLSIRIEGHTDNIGDSKKNMTLSMDRAQSVLRAIAKEHINAKRLEAKGFGMTKPIAENSTEEGRAKNRRVELVKKN